MTHRESTKDYHYVQERAKHKREEPSTCLSPRLLRRQESMWWILWFSIYNERRSQLCLRRGARNTQGEERGHFCICVESRHLT